MATERSNGVPKSTKTREYRLKPNKSPLLFCFWKDFWSLAWDWKFPLSPLPAFAKVGVIHEQGHYCWLCPLLGCLAIDFRCGGGTARRCSFLCLWCNYALMAARARATRATADSAEIAARSEWTTAHPEEPRPSPPRGHPRWTKRGGWERESRVSHC